MTTIHASVTSARPPVHRAAAPFEPLVVLVVALEPGIRRRRLGAVLDLLGRPRQDLGAYVGAAELRALGDRLEPVDAASAHRNARAAPEPIRRLAHLALALVGTDGTVPPDARMIVERFNDSLNRPFTCAAGPGDRPGDPLTARERHVAALAASGAPVREIAEAACLSPKTVEYHLTRVYRKLGVRSKAELAVALLHGMTPMVH